MSEPVTIIAIDPGYDRCGWAIGQLEGQSQRRLIAYGLLTTDRQLDHYQRYAQLSHDLDELLDEFTPQEAAMENLFFQKNQKTVMTVSEVRGVIMSCFFRHQLKLTEYTPLQIKQAVTGYGRADKAAVEKMVRLELGLSQNVKLIDDTVDAMAGLVTHLAARQLKNL